MKFSYAALCVALATSSVEGFVTQSTAPSRPSIQLQAHKKHESLGAAFTAALVGWSLASQVAFAGALTVDHAYQAPSIELAALETMDFSLPSYDSFSDSGSAKPKRDAAPSFNPFGDFQPGFVDEDRKAEEKAAAEAEKAAAEAKKTEDRKAAEARKAEEKAAAEAEAAAKKAEKEARLKAEKEKQEAAAAAAAARAKAAEEKAAAPPAPAPAPSPIAVPDMPEIKIPEFKAPEFKAPEFKAPDLDIKAPDLSGLKFSAPKIDMPKLDMPKLDMPKFDAPSAPKVDIPKVDIPKVEMPKVALPSFGGGESKPKEGAPLAPREVRDEAARQAKQAYIDADQTAKEIEQKAREAREFANGKKQDAKAARDLACEDRPGGKLLCIRNPFSTGF